jgi:hypothetical protein
MNYPLMLPTRTLCVLVVAALVLSTSAVGAIAQDGSTDRVEMTLSDAEGSVGETVTVELSISGERFAGYQAAVNYDPDIVTFKSASGVDFGDPVVNNDEDAGTVNLAQSSTTPKQSESVVAELTFAIEATGSTDIELIDPMDQTLVSDIEGTTTSTTVSTGSITGTKDDGSGSANTGGGIRNQPDDETDDTSASTSDEEAETNGTERESTERGETGSGDEGTGTDESGTDDQESGEDDATPSNESSDASSTDGTDGDGMPGFGLPIGVITLLLVMSFVARWR